MIPGKKIFITGGAGFIGTTLAKKLCGENEIVLFDNMDRDTASKSGILDHKNVSLTKGNILDKALLSDAML
mgnify:FL=1